MVWRGPLTIRCVPGTRLRLVDFTGARLKMRIMARLRGGVAFPPTPQNSPYGTNVGSSGPARRETAAARTHQARASGQTAHIHVRVLVHSFKVRDRFSHARAVGDDALRFISNRNQAGQCALGSLVKLSLGS